MERLTIVVTLPVSKAEVTLYEYLTNSEHRALKKIALSATKFKIIDGKPVEEQYIDTGFTIDMEDQALRFLVKQIVMDGQKIDDVNTFINNLKKQDADFLYEKINSLSGDSVLTDESKKK